MHANRLKIGIFCRATNTLLVTKIYILNENKFLLFFVNYVLTRSNYIPRAMKWALYDKHQRYQDNAVLNINKALIIS